jgi:hypothetical protein
MRQYNGLCKQWINEKPSTIFFSMSRYISWIKFLPEARMREETEMVAQHVIRELTVTGQSNDITGLLLREKGRSWNKTDNR